MPPLIVPIVEGDGELQAVPLLLRRVLDHLKENAIQIAAPKKLKRHTIESKLPSALKHAANEKDCEAIIVMLDADDDCAQELAARMSWIASQQNITLPVAMVCPNAEYEAWFIASIDAIRGHSIGHRKALFDSTTSCPKDVEGIRDAKGWLSDRMLEGKSYKPTQDQAPLTARIDFDLAAGRSRSFRRLCHAVQEIVDGIRSSTANVTP